jgi:hypothetical protein
VAERLCSFDKEWPEHKPDQGWTDNRRRKIDNPPKAAGLEKSQIVNETKIHPVDDRRDESEIDQRQRT